MGDNTRPTPPAFPTAAQVPSELLGLKRWVGWQAEWDSSNEKWRKPPHSPVTGEKIGPVEKNAEHFLPFEQALAGAMQHGLDGVGFVFIKDDGYIGIDFDNCVKDGVIHPVVANWLKWLPTYMEISPSGTGIHVIGKGKIAKALTATPLPGADGATVEMYSHSRYFTFTGRVIR